MANTRAHPLPTWHRYTPCGSKKSITKSGRMCLKGTFSDGALTFLPGLASASNSLTLITSTCPSSLSRTISNRYSYRELFNPCSCFYRNRCAEMAQKENIPHGDIYVFEPSPGIEPGTSSFAYTPIYKSDIWGLDCILRIPRIFLDTRRSVPCQSFGPELCFRATVLDFTSPLTVIRDSCACFQYTGQEVIATYHGCALPTELRWLSILYSVTLKLALNLSISTHHIPWMLLTAAVQVVRNLSKFRQPLATVPQTVSLYRLS